MRAEGALAIPGTTQGSTRAADHARSRGEHPDSIGKHERTEGVDPGVRRFLVEVVVGQPVGLGQTEVAGDELLRRAEEAAAREHLVDELRGDAELVDGKHRHADRDRLKGCRRADGYEGGCRRKVGCHRPALNNEVRRRVRELTRQEIGVAVGFRVCLLLCTDGTHLDDDTTCGVGVRQFGQPAKQPHSLLTQRRHNRLGGEDHIGASGRCPGRAEERKAGQSELLRQAVRQCDRTEPPDLTCAVEHNEVGLRTVQERLAACGQADPREAGDDHRARRGGSDNGFRQDVGEGSDGGHENDVGAFAGDVDDCVRDIPERHRGRFNATAA